MTTLVCRCGRVTSPSDPHVGDSVYCPACRTGFVVTSVTLDRVTTRPATAEEWSSHAPMCTHEALNPHSSVIMECSLPHDHPEPLHLERNGSHSWSDEGRTCCEHLVKQECSS